MNSVGDGMDWLCAKRCSHENDVHTKTTSMQVLRRSPLRNAGLVHRAIRAFRREKPKRPMMNDDLTTPHFAHFVKRSFSVRRVRNLEHSCEVTVTSKVDVTYTAPNPGHNIFGFGLGPVSHLPVPAPIVVYSHTVRNSHHDLRSPIKMKMIVYCPIFIQERRKRK